MKRLLKILGGISKAITKTSQNVVLGLIKSFLGLYVLLFGLEMVTGAPNWLYKLIFSGLDKDSKILKVALTAFVISIAVSVVLFILRLAIKGLENAWNMMVKILSIIFVVALYVVLVPLAFVIGLIVGIIELIVKAATKKKDK